MIQKKLVVLNKAGLSKDNFEESEEKNMEMEKQKTLDEFFKPESKTDSNKGEGEDVEDSAGPGIGGISGRDDDMFYNPELGDLPEFDLPDDLMLPNIAQDLTYSQVKRI